MPDTGYIYVSNAWDRTSSTRITGVFPTTPNFDEYYDYYNRLYTQQSGGGYGYLVDEISDVYDLDVISQNIISAYSPSIQSDQDVYFSSSGVTVTILADYNDFLNTLPPEYRDKIGTGGGATHIAKVTGLLSTLENNLSDILIVAGGGGGGLVSDGTPTTGANGGGISGSGNNSANQSTGYAFGQGEASGGGGGLYGGYKAANGDSGGAGSGYIGNALLGAKKMVGFNVPTSDVASTKTESVDVYSATAEENKPKAGNGFAKITQKGNSTTVKIKWTDPPDILTNEPVPCTWAGTVVVRKEGSPPRHRWDGTLIVDSTTRDEYSVNALVDDTIEGGKTYYYGIFPYHIWLDDVTNPIKHYRYTKNVIVSTGAGHSVLRCFESLVIDNVTVPLIQLTDFSALPTGNTGQVQIYEGATLPDYIVLPNTPWIQTPHSYVAPQYRTIQGATAGTVLQQPIDDGRHYEGYALSFDNIPLAGNQIFINYTQEIYIGVIVDDYTQSAWWFVVNHHHDGYWMPDREYEIWVSRIIQNDEDIIYKALHGANGGGS